MDRARPRPRRVRSRVPRWRQARRRITPAKARWRCSRSARSASSTATSARARSTRCKECFAGATACRSTPSNVLGVLSLIFWSLMLVVSLKYVTLHPARRQPRRGRHPGAARARRQRRRQQARGRTRSLIVLGLFGAALLYGDGVITPAISVLSAVEGLEVATPAFKPYVVPRDGGGPGRAVRRAAPRHGARRRVFGPIMLVWFVVLAAAGHRADRPRTARCCGAQSAARARVFCATPAGIAFVVLGAVVLAVTGAEALYADMGHFGAARSASPGSRSCCRRCC